MKNFHFAIDDLLRPCDQGEDSLVNRIIKIVCYHNVDLSYQSISDDKVTLLFIDNETGEKHSYPGPSRHTSLNIEICDKIKNAWRKEKIRLLDEK